MRSSLIWVCTVCSDLSVPIFKIITVVRQFSLTAQTSIIFGVRRDCPGFLASCQDYCLHKMASCRDCLHDCASCRESQQEAESRGQTRQEAIYHIQLSPKEARDRGQSQLDPNMRDSLSWKRKLADWFIPCGITPD